MKFQEASHALPTGDDALVADDVQHALSSGEAPSKATGVEPATKARIESYSAMYLRWAPHEEDLLSCEEMRIERGDVDDDEGDDES